MSIRRRSSRGDIIIITVIMMKVVHGLGQPRNELGRVEVALVCGDWGTGAYFHLGVTITAQCSVVLSLMGWLTHFMFCSR